ncbi:MAG: Rab family GTPase [Woeseiaceae bacterium]
MTQITRKICIVGDFAVGKTSVVERFVNNHFSGKYLTTVGVKIDTKEISLVEPAVSVKLVLWDVAGAEEFGSREMAYLRGAAGMVFVVDGTRATTLSSVMSLKEQIQELYGQRSSVLLLNKSDLASQWQIDRGKLESLGDEFSHVFRTSAKTGDEVEAALTQLAELIVTGDIQLTK